MRSKDIKKDLNIRSLNIIIDIISQKFKLNILVYKCPNCNIMNKQNHVSYIMRQLYFFYKFFDNLSYIINHP